MGSKLCYSDTQSASLPSEGGRGGGLTWPGRGVEEVHGEEEMHKRSARSRHVWSWRGEFRRKPDDGCIGRTQPDWHQTAGTRAAPGGWPHHPLATDLHPPGNVAPWPRPEGTVVFSSFTTDIHNISCNNQKLGCQQIFIGGHVRRMKDLCKPNHPSEVSWTRIPILNMM